MKKMLALTLVLVAASTVNAQLNLFYDVRGDLTAIDNPAGTPWVNSASLSPYIGSAVGQIYPLQNIANPGGRGDGQMVWISPKMHDVCDYTGLGAPDGLDEHWISAELGETIDWVPGFLGNQARLDPLDSRLPGPVLPSTPSPSGEKVVGRLAQALRRYHISAGCFFGSNPKGNRQRPRPRCCCLFRQSFLGRRAGPGGGPGRRSTQASFGFFGNQGRCKWAWRRVRQ